MVKLFTLLLTGCGLKRIATKQDLRELYKAMASKIEDFATAVNANFAKVQSSVDNVLKDVQNLKQKIDDLQNSPGGITPADQVLLDDIQNRSNAIVAALEALDQQTDGPVTPPVPPS